MAPATFGDDSGAVAEEGQKDPEPRRVELSPRSGSYTRREG